MTKNVEKMDNKQATLDSCQTNGVIPRKRTARIIIAVAISIYLILMIFWQELLVNRLLFTFSFLSFIVGFPSLAIFSYVTYFRNAENTTKAKIFIIGSLSTLVIVGVSFFLDIWFARFLHKHLILLLLPLAVVSGIITNAVSFVSKCKLGHFSKIFLGILFIMLLPTWLSDTLPYLYTPRALTTDRLLTYSQCIQLVKNHDKYKDITIYKWGWVSHGNDIWFPSYMTLPPFNRNRLKKVFSKDELAEMKAIWRPLSRELSTLKFHKAQRDGNMLVFFNNGNRILPVPPGVLYSLGGENPNTIDSELLNASKPFIRISGDWYMSRRLVLRGPRTDIPVRTPKSIIDHSLKIEGLDLDKPHTSDIQSEAKLHFVED